jgi:putative transposase
MPRKARLDAPGTLHHVMVRGIERRRIVDDVADRKNIEMVWPKARRS